MSRSVTIAGAILALVLAGCAKQPTTTQASAPAPGGAATGTLSAPGGTRSGSATDETGRGPGGVGSGAAGATATAVRPPISEFRAVADLVDIQFDFDRADIREADARILDANATWLKTHADHLLLIEGHCDERGTVEYNTALGDRRARAAMSYLVSRGVPASRITVISYGEERPACARPTAECWARNRRAHFLAKPR
jgi:peptidoglycan-associated lipoprotein